VDAVGEVPDRAEQRLARAHRDRYLRPPGDLEQAQGVGSRGLDPDVAPAAGQADDLDLGREQAVEDRHGVVDAGVAVDHDAGRGALGHHFIPERTAPRK
jgi:hypothetical protein